jgi:hypothetical protein
MTTALTLASLWLVPLLVHPFGRCWLCGGKGNCGTRDPAGRPAARWAKGSGGASGPAPAQCTGSASRSPPTGEAR